ncbi:unnamed protein product [Somion occarium]|uniref:Carboxymuconolactone decarboxylase-like domain-containing protein n=1 Tax=Somion occarium TaxID=3059160 RepID=A0ABP1D8J8_9APHY
MAQLATAQFLQHLRSLYPHQSGSPDTPSAIVGQPWYLIAAVAFSASNKPDATAVVFQYVLNDLEKVEFAAEKDRHAARLAVARRIREAVLQSGLLSGYARAINSLVALHGVTPPELREQTTIRNTNQHITDYAENGKRLFKAMYGDTAEHVQTLLDEIYPDMGEQLSNISFSLNFGADHENTGWFSNTVGYGITYRGTNVLSQVETSYVIATANICMDTPRQIAWHLANARHGGATVEQAKAVREIAMEVASAAGIQWTEAVPEV